MTAVSLPPTFLVLFVEISFSRGASNAAALRLHLLVTYQKEIGDASGARSKAVCLIAIILSVAATRCRPCSAAGPATLEIGSPAPDFNLPGVDGKNHTLDEYRNAKVLVIIFTCNHCPTAQAYEGRIKQLAADYKDRNVALVAISPNDPLAIRPDELGYTDRERFVGGNEDRREGSRLQFPLSLRRRGSEGVARLRPGGHAARVHLRWREEAAIRRPDRQFRKTPLAATHEPRDAIDALLAGKPVPVEQTKAFGCSTKWANKRRWPRKPWMTPPRRRWI